MSNVVDFLERMGQNANLRYATSDELAKTLTSVGIASSLQQSMLDTGDRSGLEALLGANPNVCCGIAPATYDEEDGENAPDTGISLRAATVR
jgi:hypothetical protein